MRTEETSAKPPGDQPSAVYGLRHVITLTEIGRYLRTHPGAALVNIGLRARPDRSGAGRG